MNDVVLFAGETVRELSPACSRQLPGPHRLAIAYEFLQAGLLLDDPQEEGKFAIRLQLHAVEPDALFRQPGNTVPGCPGYGNHNEIRTGDPRQSLEKQSEPHRQSVAGSGRHRRSDHESSGWRHFAVELV